MYIKKITKSVKNLNDHLYFFRSPLVQKQALFGTLVDKVYDFFMDRIVEDGSIRRLTAILSSPIHKYEVQFYLQMEKILTKLMDFECLNKTDFKFQIAQMHLWYLKRWREIQFMKDPEFIEFESDRPPAPPPPAPPRTMSDIMKDMQDADWNRMTKEEQFWEIFNQQMEWKYGKQQGIGLPPGLQIYDDEKFSMREFGVWTVQGAKKVSKTGELLDESEQGEKPSAMITKPSALDA